MCNILKRVVSNHNVGTSIKDYGIHDMEIEKKSEYHIMPLFVDRNRANRVVVNIKKKQSIE